MTAPTPAAVEAAVEALTTHRVKWGSRSIYLYRTEAADIATATLTAAMPHLREQIAREVEGMQDAYLPSPRLDHAWIAGWRAAMRHAAAAVIRSAS